MLDHGVDAHEAQHAIGRRFLEEVMGQLGPPPAHEPAPAPARARVRGDGRARERRKARRAARRRNRR
jgi:hypothetical protein